MNKQTVRVGARTLELETGRIAKQAHGAVLLREGNTVILATAVYAPQQTREVDFLPLTVDYREYFSAAGRIPGGFLRREGRANDREVVASRLCDRSLRPLFPEGYAIETQIITTVLSYGAGSDAPVLAMIAAAAALHLSEIPWQGPLVALRVARSAGELVVLPATDNLPAAELDLVVSLGREGIVMLEGGARQVPDEQMLEALAFAEQSAAPLLDALDALREAAGKPKATVVPKAGPPPAVVALEEAARERLTAALALPEKLARQTAVRAAKAQALEQLHAGVEGDGGAAPALVAQAAARLSELEGRILREQVIESGRRVDGRGPEDIRPIACEVDWLPGTHGSALFTRGETQAIVTLTLGAQQDRMLIESLDGVSYERFMLHYNFPPYSVGEVRPLRGPGRREVGHGALARRALVGAMPVDDSFPYTVRIVSEITESNGSSSMATVCGGCLALMDGGVPMTAPVAGIAMGLIREGDRTVVLSDILGDEDHLGDMDFKVAGTEQGVTAIQMDNKIGSLPREVMEAALAQARRGRLHILGEMAKALAAPRPEVKSNAPVIASLTITTGRVRDLIGPGGRVIQELQRTHGVRIEVDEAGQVRISAPNREALLGAREAVQAVAGSLDVDAVYEGVVTGVKEFGAFVRIRGQEGLVHISEWDLERVERMVDVVKEGDIVQVKVLVPDKQGRLSLSRKAAL